MNAERPSADVSLPCLGSPVAVFLLFLGELLPASLDQGVRRLLLVLRELGERRLEMLVVLAADVSEKLGAENPARGILLTAVADLVRERIEGLQLRLGGVLEMIVDLLQRFHLIIAQLEILLLVEDEVHHVLLLELLGGVLVALRLDWSLGDVGVVAASRLATAALRVRQ